MIKLPFLSTHLSLEFNFHQKCAMIFILFFGWKVNIETNGKLTMRTFE